MPMTVRDLIENLSQFDSELEVKFNDDTHGQTEIAAIDIQQDEEDSDKEVVLLT